MEITCHQLHWKNKRESNPKNSQHPALIMIKYVQQNQSTVIDPNWCL